MEKQQAGNSQVRLVTTAVECAPVVAFGERFELQRDQDSERSEGRVQEQRQPPAPTLEELNRLAITQKLQARVV